MDEEEEISPIAHLQAAIKGFEKKKSELEAADDQIMTFLLHQIICYLDRALFGCHYVNDWIKYRDE